ncbi:MAG: response regulator [Sulfuriferula sp.]|nr:response regulator [Sulfuriferula sp.]
MTRQNDEFQKRLRATFQVEADEHLQAMSAGLIELENHPVQARYAEIVETVFREVHSLKGAARAVNLREIESACQVLESVFSALKARQLDVSPSLFDLLHEAIDGLSALLAMDDAAMPVAGKSLVASLTRRLSDALHGQFVSSATTTASAASPVATYQEQLPPVVSSDEMAAIAPVQPLAGSLASETVRVSTQKLDAVMRQVEELLSPRLASAQRANELREVVLSFATWKKRQARMRPVLRQLERYVAANGGGLPRLQAQGLPKLLEYLESEQVFMKTLEERLLRLSKFAARDRRTLAGMSDSLLHDVKEMHLLPFSSLLEIFPRFTRELAREQGKQVKLVIHGGEIEIDRRILEEMKDPLMHLLRNCIDHGIEQPVVRRDKGKPEQGCITVAITQKDGGKIEIMVADDGAGIDADKVQTAARKLGLVTDEVVAQMSEQEQQSLVFLSGISTSRIITDISGRGIGLAIVREKVERMNGVVVLESDRDGEVAHAGTSFRITLPLMLATFRGVLVRTGEQHFIIPAISVERVARVAQQDIQTVENRATIPLGGQAVALVYLGDVLAVSHRRAVGGAPEQVPVVVLGAGQKHVAFGVDAILGEQEVLVKTLGRQLARVRNVAGASVLGTGQVVAVLNVPDLLKSAATQAAPPAADIAVQVQAEMPSVLVVEDSITSRSLLKNILEAAGYRVVTAVDGVDAYTLLKTDKFDLIVSDVEMPRMDGFDLTAKVRMDKQLADLPVVLVTALESREHRERGIDVGANAYIVKSSFDQSNLLEVIQRLI